MLTSFRSMGSFTLLILHVTVSHSLLTRKHASRNSSAVYAQRLISTADLLREFQNATKSFGANEELTSLKGELADPSLSGLAREMLELSSPAQNAVAQCAKRDAWDQYVICPGLLEGHQIEAHSYGVKGYDVYGEHMSKAPYNFPVHLYDCFNTNQPTKFRNEFHPTCVASKTSVDQQGHHFETLHQHLARVGPVSAVVKLDIEGGEFEVLESLQNEDANKIAMMTVEYHSGLGGCGEVLERRHTQELAPALRNMGKFFSVVEGYGVFWGTPCRIDGYSFPQALAVTYVNKQLLKSF
eukprot:gnl/MRDRNA2_/MRDRNA2_110702_c0_seq1.p1 gnl/MRDRNA2_/MRDRNA2_110702_c0~~gnl/MRDRNA2_/MRDRNA2_110702_c0_seq1.p1  ORF type:complete len:297 (+),score=61.03 gnl/MRDRNA2_/MRDRNA2_110702_c0_seq1:180-1070(+)